MSEEVIVTIALVVIVGGIMIAGMVDNYKKKHKSCPQCGKRNSMTITAAEEVPKGGNNRIFFRTETWICSKCGHQEVVKKTVNYGTNAGTQMSERRHRELYDD